MVGVVGIGWFGARSTPAPPAVERVATADSAAIAPTDGWLRLDAPGTQDEVVTTRSIFVRGEVGPAVAEVWLGLESRNGKILASRTIRRTDAMPTSMAYEAQFRMASPRATGRLFVTVTAIGADGIPTQSIRRRIETKADLPQPDDARGPDLPQSPHADALVDGSLVEQALP